MRIAVTGASGYLGRHISRIGHELGHEIVPVGRSDPSASRIDLLGTLPPIADAVAGCECIIHAAMPREGGASAIALMTQNVCDAAAVAGVHRIIYVSSIGVIDPDVFKVFEQSPVDPMPEDRDAYAQGKIRSEAIVSAWASVETNAACIARPGPILGDGRWWSDRFGVRIGRRWIRVGNSPIPWIRVEQCAEHLLELAAEKRPPRVIHLHERADASIIADLIDDGRVVEPTLCVSYKAARRTIQMVQPLAWFLQERAPGLLRLRRFDARFRPRQNSSWTGRDGAGATRRPAP